jgi:hypothetical protein
LKLKEEGRLQKNIAGALQRESVREQFHRSWVDDALLQIPFDGPEHSQSYFLRWRRSEHERTAHVRAIYNALEHPSLVDEPGTDYRGTHMYEQKVK